MPVDLAAELRILSSNSSFLMEYLGTKLCCSGNTLLPILVHPLDMPIILPVTPTFQTLIGRPELLNAPLPTPMTVLGLQLGPSSFSTVPR